MPHVCRSELTRSGQGVRGIEGASDGLARTFVFAPSMFESQDYRRLVESHTELLK